MVEIDAVSDVTKWGKHSSLVERYTEWIVETVTEANVKATFFILGWIAEHHPNIVKMISESGHEVATHSYWHRRVDQLTPKEFYEDMKQSIDVLEQQSGKKVLGFRAPSFSITPGTEWAFDVMHELGLVYDASLFPCPRGHGGYPCSQEPHEFKDTPSGKPMLELPMSIMRIGPTRLPFSGGGYMRLLPKWMIRRGFQYMHQQNLPAVVYLHPRDFAPDTPRVAMPLHRKFKCYVGLNTTKNKLNMLLKHYQFDTCAGVLGIDQNNHTTIHDTTSTCLS